MGARAKPLRVLKLLREFSLVVLNIFIAAVIILVFYTNTPLWLDSLNNTVNAPVVYKGLLAMAGLYFLLQPRQLLEFSKTPYARWCFALLALYTLNYLRISAAELPLQDKDYEYDKIQQFLMAPALAYLIFCIDRKYFKPLLMALSAIVPATLLFDFFYPGVLQSLDAEGLAESDKTRVAGTWLNSNLGGEAALLSLILVRNYLTKIPMALIYTVSILALVATGSRAGLGGAFVFGIFLLYRRKLPIYYLVIPFLVIASFSTLLNIMEDTAESTGRSADISDMRNRLEFFSGDNEIDDSSMHRSALVSLTLQKSLEKPILGHGVQYIDPAWLVGPHNMPLAMFHPYGIAGLAIWLMLGYILYKYSGRESIINPCLFVYIWFSMFTHNMYSGHFWYIFFALSVYQNYNGNAKQKKLEPPLVTLSRRGSGKTRRASRSDSEKRVDRLVKSIKGK